MFEIVDSTIHVTRGDIGSIDLSVKTSETEKLMFVAGDIIRFKVFQKKRPDKVIIQKDIKVVEDTTVVVIRLSGDETKIGELISKPVDYWYEIERNPDTAPQTIVAYDRATGPKIFRLYPEGGEIE